MSIWPEKVTLICMDSDQGRSFRTLALQSNASFNHNVCAEQKSLHPPSQQQYHQRDYETQLQTMSLKTTYGKVSQTS